MEPIFENKHQRDVEIYRDVSAFCFFGQPIIKILLLVSSLLAIIFATFTDKRLLGVIVLLFVVALCLGGYHRLLKISLAREKEVSKEPVIYTVQFFDDKITLSNTLGNSASYEYSTISKIVCSKSSILLITKAKLIITLKRSAWTNGSDADFVSFLRNKGFKVNF